MRATVEAIDAVLPQTQCRRCGYTGCRPYAEAIAAGEASINRCPPGGDAGIGRLASLLDTPVLPLDPSCGREGPRTVAHIESEHCIGCTKCIQACPVDAIIGAAKRMHTVIAALCTGCDLCIPPCPVDCIVMSPLAPQPQPLWSESDALAARNRYEARARRLLRVQADRDQRLAARAVTKLEALQSEPETRDTARKRAAIEAAIARARERAAARAAVASTGSAAGSSAGQSSQEPRP